MKHFRTRKPVHQNDFHVRNMKITRKHIRGEVSISGNTTHHAIYTYQKHDKNKQNSTPGFKFFIQSYNYIIMLTNHFLTTISIIQTRCKTLHIEQNTT